MKKFFEYCKTHKKQIVKYILWIVWIWVLLSMFLSDMTKDSNIEIVPYSSFLEDVKSGKVDTIYYNSDMEYMTYTLFNDDTKDMSLEDRKSYKHYKNSDKRQVLYPGGDEFRADMLEKYDVNLKVVSKPHSFLSILMDAITLAVPLAFFFVILSMFKQQMRGISKKDVIQKSDVKFTDIIGHEEILDDVKFITELISNPDKGNKIGAKAPKGLLLTGEPGTGKTLIAKAIAGEAGVPFLYQNASSFIEMYVGLGAKRVRDLFKIAREQAPCIIFIDEIDAIGTDRNSNKGTSENEQTINALLQEMDGFTGREGIFVIAATNRADKLDKALVRSGRFDRQITVNPPRDWTVRRDLFKHYLNKFSVSDDVDIDNLSKQVSGFTGADIAMVCNEASIIAMMQNKTAIDNDCIEEAIDKKVFHGNRSKKESFIEDKKIVAYHEAGHAVASYLLGEPIARASIQSTISGVGGAVFNEDKMTLFQTNRDFINRIMIAYAGRASEEIKFGDVTTGASNDITQATDIIVQYVERFGFDKDFGMLDVSLLSERHLMSGNEMAQKFGHMSKDLYDDTLMLLKDNYDKVELLATKLLECETLSGDTITKLFES